MEKKKASHLKPYNSLQLNLGQFSSVQLNDFTSWEAPKCQIPPLEARSYLKHDSTAQIRSCDRYDNCVNRLRAARIQLHGAPRCQRPLPRAGSHLKHYRSDHFRSDVRSYKLQEALRSTKKRQQATGSAAQPQRTTASCVNRFSTARIQRHGAPRYHRPLPRAGSHLKHYNSDQCRSVVRSYNSNSRGLRDAGLKPQFSSVQFSSVQLFN